MQHLRCCSTIYRINCICSTCFDPVITPLNWNFSKEEEDEKMVEGKMTDECPVVDSGDDEEKVEDGEG